MIEAHDKAVDAELVQGRMRVDCSWHVKLFGSEKVMREAAPGHEGDGVSGGICPECQKKLREERSVLMRAKA